jgi:hypothetical protein
MCTRFFQTHNIRLQGQIRTDGKKRFYRLSLSNQEVVFEVPIQSLRLARMAVSLQALQMFNPSLAHEWLQKYKKVGNLLKSHL